MAILIEGMEMPKEGNWKTVRIYPDGTCAVPNWQGDCMLLKGAQAAELPPHGRLGDLDQLKELFREVIGNIAKRKEIEPALEHMVRASAMVIEMIDDAPTIIEAEGESDDNWFMP